MSCWVRKFYCYITGAEPCFALSSMVLDARASLSLSLFLSRMYVFAFKLSDCVYFLVCLVWAILFMTSESSSFVKSFIFDCFLFCWSFFGTPEYLAFFLRSSVMKSMLGRQSRETRYGLETIQTWDWTIIYCKFRCLMSDFWSLSLFGSFKSMTYSLAFRVPCEFYLPIFAMARTWANWSRYTTSSSSV